jgi:hypothetical protein
MKPLLDRRGAVAAVSAVVLVAVIGFAGLAVDLTRIWLVSARLKTAVDAASLVAARSIESPTRDADATALFWANYTRNGRQTGYMLSVATTPVITPVGETRIRVAADATVPTTLFSIINRGNTLLREVSLAEREGSGLELAIVLDQTSSMRAAAPGFASKLAAAQNATRTLLDILYGQQDVRRNMWVSVVPFARTINVGPRNTAFLDTTSMPPGWNPADWSGCVEARRNGEDITDIGPATLGGRFRPFFDRSTYQQVGWAVNPTGPTLSDAEALANGHPVGRGACSTGNAYGPVNRNFIIGGQIRSIAMRYCRGDNDWTNPNGLSTNAADAARYNPEYAALVNAGFTGIGPLPTSAAGPNRLCALNPILPLTASRAAVQAAVDAITAPVRSGGTTVVAGMQGAWYTLSPDWQGWWPDIATNSTIGALPLAYGTRNMAKAVIILTDGDNNWQGFYAGGAVRGSPTASELLYNAYGRAADWNANFPTLPISPIGQTSADSRLDARFSAICAAMKGTASANPADHRIRIYVVGFEVASTAHRNLLRACASSPSAPYYLEAPTAADLQGAFAQIANALTGLRLVE